MKFARQTDIFDPSTLAWPCNLIGLGGIGSAVILVLAKLGFKDFRLWDSDMLEPENIPNQFLYREMDVSKLKTSACQEILEGYSQDIKVRTHNERFPGSEGSSVEGIVISGVDKMTSRSDIWETIKFNANVPLYLDGRLGGEMLELHSLNPCVIDEIERYENFLFPDSEVVPLPCSARAIIYTPVVLAGLIANNITRWHRQERYYGRIMYDLRTMTQLLESPTN